MDIRNIAIVIISGNIALYSIDTMNGINIYSVGMFLFIIGFSFLISETYNIIKEHKDESSKKIRHSQ